jgi:flavorubredoxin
MSNTVEICSNVHYVGVRHPDLTVFDELFPTRRGTTYNSYLVLGKEKIALIDTVKESFSDEFLDKVSSIVPLEKIDLVVINHAEPDHSGALGRLLEKNPDLTVCCSRPGEKFLEQLYERPLKTRVVNEGEEIDLGGKTLRFILAPFLHWPDTMFTYLPEDAILFSCDAFGAHYCGNGLFNDEVGAFSAEFAFYFDAIMRPFKDKIRDAVAKVEGLDLSMICPSHGPVLRKNPQGAVESYAAWAAAPADGTPRALLVVLSPHGNTRSMGDAVREGLESRGVEVVTKSLVNTPDEEIRDELERTDLLLVGSPTINRDAPPPVWRALSLLSSVTPRGKLGAVFGSYGWSGEGVKLVEERLKGLKYDLPVSGLCFRFKPTAEDIQACREFGTAAAEALLAKG